MQLCISVTPRDPRTTIDQMLDLGVAQHGPAAAPTKARVNYEFNLDPQAFWEAWRHGLPRFSLVWDHDGRSSWYGGISWDTSCAKVQNTNHPFTPDELIGTLNRLDFTIANVYRAYYKWWYSVDYHPTGMSDGHFTNGSFAAFSREDGHRRLVSRRWLEYGPWRLLRDQARDLTVVQYHDLAADEATALEQARPGHLWMGIDDSGGFIQTDYPFGMLRPSFYDRGARTSVVLVHGAAEPVTHEQMLEAAAIKLWQPFPDHPVDQVAFVFFDEANARRHLHDLWLRGLEVRVMGRQGEVRFDDRYDPPPPIVPDWVDAVRQREGR